jgi:hypothetical protein
MKTHLLFEDIAYFLWLSEVLNSHETGTQSTTCSILNRHNVLQPQQSNKHCNQKNKKYHNAVPACD